MYDFAHCISDAIEGITHSLCTLEFQDNRQLYNWILSNINIKNTPQQYEFSRLNLEYTVLSKRKLKILVHKNIVNGWDDPRMPTISGLRKRGYTPNSIKNFCYRIGVTKKNNYIKMNVLESCIRDELNDNVSRFMAVINPVKIVIENLPVNYEENIFMKKHPKNEKLGIKIVPFTKEIYIDYFDFCKIEKKKHEYLNNEKMIRLRNAYTIKIHKIIKNKKKQNIILYCTYDKLSFKQSIVNNKYNRKYKIIHWVSATKGIKAIFNIYNHLFNHPYPDLSENFITTINKKSLIVYSGFVEPEIIKNIKFERSFQFEREGYFYVDNKYFINSKLIFNRIVSLFKK